MIGRVKMKCSLAMHQNVRVEIFPEKALWSRKAWRGIIAGLVEKHVAVMQGSLAASQFAAPGNVF